MARPNDVSRDYHPEGADYRYKHGGTMGLRTTPCTTRTGLFSEMHT